MTGTGETMEVQLQRAINERGAALLDLAAALDAHAAEIKALADAARAAAAAKQPTP